MSRVHKDGNRDGIGVGLELAWRQLDVQARRDAGSVYASDYPTLQAAVDAAFLEDPARQSTGAVCT